MAIPVQLDANKTLTVAESGLHFYLDVPGRVAASDIFTFNAANVSADNTVTIDGKVYTFKAVPNNANDGEVDIGAASTNSRDNLKDAINLGPTAGTDYSTATTLHPTVSASDGTALQLIVSAKIKGPKGNDIAVLETSNGTWATTTLAGGADGVTPANNELVITLPTGPQEGTNYKFTTEDNGVGVNSGQTYRTNWRINSPIVDGFVVRGNVGSVPRILQTKPTDNSTFTNEAIVIGFSGSTQNSEKRYEIGETLELTYFNGKWRGNILTGSNILGIGDI